MEGFPANGSTSGWDTENVTNYFRVVFATLSVYDYWLNFSRERQLIWQHKKSMASVLYVAIRYVNISEALFLTTQAVLFSPASRADDLTPDTCGVEFKVLTASSCLAYMVLALFSATRTYALFNRDLRVFICVLVLGLLVPINLIYYAAKTVFSTKTLPIPHCVYSTPSPVGNALKFGAVEFHRTLSRKLDSQATSYSLFVNSSVLLGVICSVVFELVVIVLTWIKTVPTIRQLRGTGLGVSQSLCYVVCWNGTLHFSVLVTMSCISMISLTLKPLPLTIIMGDTLLSIVVAGFILDLRQDFVMRLRAEGHSLHISDISNIQFATDSGVVIHGTVGDDEFQPPIRRTVITRFDVEC